jgi:hypothetical protein
MKLIKKIAVSVAAAALCVSSAHALSITPATGPQWTGVENSTTKMFKEISDLGITLGSEVYKQDQGSATDSGALAGYYTTTFLDTPTDPSGATIAQTVAGAAAPSTVAKYLLVKDGNQIPAWYLFNLEALNWNGVETLSLSGFWPGNGAISHVSLYGSQPARTVPDGGATAALLGMGVLGLAAVRRKK